MLRTSIITLALIMTACAPAQRVSEPPEPAPENQAESASPELNLHQQAQAMVAEGRVLAAVRLYRQLADESPSPQREKIRLDIVALLLNHGYPELAQDSLAPIELVPLDPELDLYRRSLNSQLALRLGQTQLALETLPAPESASTANVAAHILLTRARIHERLGNTRQSLRDLAEVETLSGDPDTLEILRAELWRQLQALTDEVLADLAAADADPVLSGWSALALALRNAPMQAQGIRQALSEWRQMHPDHPATDGYAERLVEQLFAAHGYPERITLLLPLSGRLSKFAKAVQDGFLTAYYDTDAGQIQPQVDIIDVGSEGRDVVSAYREAVTSGSELVIGPLDKTGVRQIADLGELPIPVLSLNYLEPGANAPPDLFQFGLLPEDEAAQAAETAIADNLRHAVVLTPDSAWGKRLRDTFVDRFETLGGSVLSSAEYPLQANDFSGPIRRALHLDRSDVRHRQLRQILGSNPRFEPRRREDVDFVFIGADPRQARLLKPQLRFHRAADLPVYATSRVFTGTPASEDDHDLEGLLFCDLPWLLEDRIVGSARFQRVAALWPEQLEDQPRLLALGMDAYEIVPFMRRMALQKDAVFDGRTGILRIDDRRRIHRSLRWAVFERGVPVPVRTPASPNVTARLAVE